MEETVRQLSSYADQHKIRDLVQELVCGLLRDQPEDPVSHLLTLLRRKRHAPRVLILGPPSVGKRTLARKLCAELGAVHVTLESLQVGQSELTVTEQVALLHHKLQGEDCIIKGWVLHGFTVAHIQSLLQGSALPDHVVLLDAPLDVLAVRSSGRMLDPLTGDVYHQTFVRPLHDAVVQRLVLAPGPTEKQLEKELLRHRCDVTGLSFTFQHTLRSFNADVPPLELFHQALAFIRTGRCYRTPRVLLLGPPGSGKSLQAQLLADKYKMVDVCPSRLLRSVAADGSSLGTRVRVYVEEDQPVPEALLLQVLEERLSEPDCSSRGWILHGVPRDLQQLRWLQEGPHRPNRVFFLDLTDHICLERVCQRATDPITGERYHAVTQPAPTDQVQKRLLTRPEDQIQSVKRLLEEFRTHRAALQSAFPDMIQIDADQDPGCVLETLEQRLTTT
ncbi:adenylate kinase 8 [Synchiropus splendidus]|uniref:adenylate kinase 8 n=1 Tax=Synchiropus splendidus TaxID=270530 RepID=UPI00237DC0AB|nr:adenylate kinase 8 [Synchiropus splendidus]